MLPFGDTSKGWHLYIISYNCKQTYNYLKIEKLILERVMKLKDPKKEKQNFNTT